MSKIRLGTIKNDLAASALPPKGLKEGQFDDFWKKSQITSRSMRSMHNDITRVALAATEPEMVQNKVFLSPSVGNIILKAASMKIHEKGSTRTPI